jgi:hypothetical protein
MLDADQMFFPARAPGALLSLVTNNEKVDSIRE